MFLRVDYLARFKRKTLCYSKSVVMINLTLLLFFVRLLYHLSFKCNPKVINKSEALLIYSDA